MKATGNGAAAVSREAERIAQNGINGVNRGTTKPIISAKSGIIPSSSASEINRAAQERAAHSQAKADFVSMPLDALNSAGAWLDKGLTNLAGSIDASWAGEGVGDAAEWITEKEKLANEKACAAYKHCINGLQELLPNSDVERILGGSGLILVGGFKMTGGAILTLAGAATSHLGIGFGGITAGTITGLSGVSDIEQGINEIKLGLRNDRTTRTGNYVRDTLYDGNDTIYHLSTGTAAMAGMALKPYVIPRKNPALAGGERKDIAKKAAMGEKGGSLTIMEGGNYSTSEVNAAKYMADLENDVVLRPPVGTRAGGGTSDLLVNGISYDVYTPTTDNPSAIIRAITKKNTQTIGIVLDLSNTTVTVDDLGNILSRVTGAIEKNGATCNINNIVVMPK